MRTVLLLSALLLASCQVTPARSPHPHQWHGATPSYIGRNGLDDLAIDPGAIAKLVINLDGLVGWAVMSRHQSGPDFIRMKNEDLACIVVVERRPRINDSAHLLAEQLRDEIVSSGIAASVVADNVPYEGRSSFACRDYDEGLACYGSAIIQPEVVEYGFSVMAMCPIFADQSAQFADEMMTRTRLVYSLD